VHLGVVGTTALSSVMVGISAKILPIKIIFFIIGVAAALCGFYSLSYKPIKKLT